MGKSLPPKSMIPALHVLQQFSYFRIAYAQSSILQFNVVLIWLFTKRCTFRYSYIHFTPGFINFYFKIGQCFFPQYLGSSNLHIETCSVESGIYDALSAYVIMCAPVCRAGACFVALMVAVFAAPSCIYPALVADPEEMGRGTTISLAFRVWEASSFPLANCRSDTSMAVQVCICL